MALALLSKSVDLMYWLDWTKRKNKEIVTWYLLTMFYTLSVATVLVMLMDDAETSGAMYWTSTERVRHC